MLAANELALLLIKENNSTQAKEILLQNITKASLDQNETDRTQFILAEMMYFEGNIDSAIVLLLPISENQNLILLMMLLNDYCLLKRTNNMYQT